MDRKQKNLRHERVKTGRPRPTPQPTESEKESGKYSLKVKRSKWQHKHTHLFKVYGICSQQHGEVYKDYDDNGIKNKHLTINK